MAVYAVGDVQGCYKALSRLLKKLDFNTAQDHLWFVGDLVNRGEQSLDTLRFLCDLDQQRVQVVLGNHDLHLLGVADGACNQNTRDTLEQVLNAKDSDKLLNWLRKMPLCVYDDESASLLAHAGILPAWSIDQALNLSAEVSRAINDPDTRQSFFKKMYGNTPASWSEELIGNTRLRFITNVFTRIRFCNKDGSLDLEEKLSPENSKNKCLVPWFELLPPDFPGRILFGHWSTLGLRKHRHYVALDTGCVWGGCLTAVRVDHPDTPVTQVDC